MQKDGENNYLNLESGEISNQVRPWRIIFGNDLSSLADSLGEEFFPSSSRPFASRIVAVPNTSYKDFLFHHFATKSRLKIAAGVQVLPLNQAIMEILDSISASPSKKRIPSFLELSLAIEEKLHEIFDRGEFTALSVYLSASGGEKKRKRISSLSDEVARMFASYGLYGKHFLPLWLSNQGWQQSIWKSIFSNDSHWTYPLESLNQDPAAISKFSGKIALFGFSYLSPAHLSFFASAAATVFQFSPCALFWEDFTSDKQRLYSNRFFQRKGVKEVIREEIDRYMEQRHPLLGNWGKLGREMLKSLGGFLQEEKEVYVENDQNHLLSSLKQSLLTLDESTSLQEDDSIQLHSAISKLREVEILRDLLETLLQKDQICLRDILVVCPDIPGYAPYIHMVFSESSFPYAIEGMPLSSYSDTVKGFLQLIELVSENYSLDCIFKLLRCPSFMEKRGFSPSEVHQLNKWFKQAQIRKGISGTANSWEDGIDRLLHGLGVAPDPKAVLDVWPLDCIPGSDVDLFNRFLEFFSELKGDLSFFSGLKGAGDWLDHLLRIADKYFVIDWTKETFFQELKSLSLSSRYLEEKFWDFESISRIIYHLSQKPAGKIPSSKLEKISFVPLSQGNIVPARILACLGMNEGSFPRSDVRSSLCQAMPVEDYFPVKADEDRFLFLEMLAQAKDYLIFSYQRIDPEDGKHQGPSFLIDELDQYLEKRGSHLMKTDHPAFPFDSMYFAPDAKVKKWSHAEYLAAKAHYTETVSVYFPKPQIIPFFNLKPHSMAAQEEMTIDVRQLKKFASNPLRFYFNETLKIFLKEEQDAEESDFLISHLDKFLLRKEALRASLSQVMNQSSAKGKLPRGLFKAAAAGELEDEMHDLLEELEGFDLSPSEISSVHLSSSSLSISLEGSRVVHIVGELEDVTPKGLLAHAENNLKSLVKLWPLYLIYRSLAPENQFLLLTKKGVKIEVAMQDPKALLASYIEYFLLARQSPSPLMPDWSKAIFEENEEGLVSAMSKEADDLYLNYLKRRQFEFDPKELFSLWGAPLKNAFSPLIDGAIHAL